MIFLNCNNENENHLFFTGFETKKIENKEYLKINILERNSNTGFSIYEKYSDDLYDVLCELSVFSCVDNKIYVVYKNGRLKFAIKLD